MPVAGRLFRLAQCFYMVSTGIFRELALSFPEVVEVPHFENTSFTVRKKIFVTLSEKNNRVCVKLSEIDQSAFCSFDSSVVYPVPNKWGKKGWTLIELGKVEREMLLDALTTAYCVVAPKALSKTYREERERL